jgi:hypothetical protein
MTLLTQNPPISYVQISTRLSTPADIIEPARHRCLDKLRGYPAIAALISADLQTTGSARAGGRHASLSSRGGRSARPVSYRQPAGL